MTKSSAVVTKVGDGISLIDSVVQKPFQWLESIKSDLGNLTRAYNENETLKRTHQWKRNEWSRQSEGRKWAIT